MLTVMIGVVLQFGGYYGMWLAAMGKFECSYVGMLLLAMAACNGQAWYETAGLVTSVRNFETERCVDLILARPPSPAQADTRDTCATKIRAEMANMSICSTVSGLPRDFCAYHSAWPRTFAQI